MRPNLEDLESCIMVTQAAKAKKRRYYISAAVDSRERGWGNAWGCVCGAWQPGRVFLYKLPLQDWVKVRDITLLFATLNFMHDNLSSV